MNEKEKIINECFNCVHKREWARDSHIYCEKPDIEMRGDEYGVRNGWFMYPFRFDPTWKTKSCNNFESKAVSSPINPSVSHIIDPC